FYLIFFSIRCRHTIFSRDWSSDVCSSDLGCGRTEEQARCEQRYRELRRTHSRLTFDGPAPGQGRELAPCGSARRVRHDGERPQELRSWRPWYLLVEQLPRQDSNLRPGD